MTRRIHLWCMMAPLCLLLASQALAYIAPTIKTGCAFRCRPYTYDYRCFPNQEGSFDDALSRANWQTCMQFENNSLPELGTPAILLSTVEAGIVDKSALVFDTHGISNGTMLVELYRNENYMFGNFLSYLGSYDTTEIGLGRIVQIGAGCVTVDPLYGIGYTSVGIGTYLGSVIGNNTALVYGAYCYSTVGYQSWSAETFVGYAGSELSHFTICPAQEVFWNRMSCADDGFKGDATAKDAAEGYVAGVTDCFTALFAGRCSALPRLKVFGAEDWVLSTDLGCLNTAANFVDAGAFGTTVYCKTYGESNTSSIELRGYENWADYPENPEIIETLVPAGGYGIIRAYVVSLSGSYAIYDWAEKDSLDRTMSSEPFAITSKPSNWDDDYAADSTDVDDLWTVEVLQAPESLNLTSQSSTCEDIEVFTADIVVYSSNAELASPIAAQIAIDCPSKKVRTIIGAGTTAQECLNNIANVREYNDAVNLFCDPSTPYPVFPGPELFIVGSQSVVNTASFDDDNQRCGSDHCKSDYLIYDTDGDGRPDGPVSRIPVRTVGEAQTVAASAHDFNHGINVDPGHVILLEGAALSNGGSSDTSLVPQRFLNNVRSRYTSIGMGLRARLRDIDFWPYGEAEGDRAEAFTEKMNEGVREVFALGGYESGDRWPGGFVPCGIDFAGFSTKQRIVTWIPDCNVHNMISACYPVEGDPSIVERFMTNNLDFTTIAASVGHLGGAWDRQHYSMSDLLSEERYDAATGVVASFC